MTIDSARNNLIKIKYDIAKGEIIRHKSFEREELLMQEEYEAVGLAIESLCAWGKVKAEIEESRGALKTMIDGEWCAGKLKGLDCAVAIIDKHLSEIENG